MTRKKSLVLHVGPHKTGSTALQTFFDMNRTTLLNHGIFYPAGLIFKDAQHELPELLLGLSRFDVVKGLNFKDVYGEILDTFKASESDTLLLSSENFSDLTLKQLQVLLNQSRNQGITDFQYIRFDFSPEKKTGILCKSIYQIGRMGIQGR